MAPLFTEPGWNMHTPAEIGIDDFQSNRSPDKHYRTTPLKGLWSHQTGGFYHDGRFATRDRDNPCKTLIERSITAKIAISWRGLPFSGPGAYFASATQRSR
jgi:hypothetical protein